MLKQLQKILPIVIGIIIIVPFQAKAASELATREEVFQFLKSAFKAQVSLSEQGRDIEEIYEILDPYFAEGYKQKFFNENLVYEDGKYLTYGSDFAPYYIPFFMYSDNTEVAFKKSKIYVYEFFPENAEGPVTYQSHYEGLLLEKSEGQWRISQYFNGDLPEELISKVPQAIQKTSMVQDKGLNDGEWSTNIRLLSFNFEIGLFPFQNPFYDRSLLTKDYGEPIYTWFNRNDLKKQVALN